MSNQPNSLPVSAQEFNQRVEEAAAAMRLKVVEVLYHLSRLGIEANDEDAIEVLESEDFTFEDARAELTATLTPLIGAHITPEWFEKLKEAGCHVRDKNQVIVEGAKIIGFRRGFRILKGSSAEKDEAKENPVQVLVEQNRPVEQWSDQELVEEYGVDCESRVAEELSRRAKGKRCVVFNNGNSINVEATVFLLRQARRNQPIGQTWAGAESGGKPVRVHHVGEFPLEYVEECPLHSDVILVGGYCEKCQASWSGISDEDRVIIRVAKMVDPTLGSGAIGSAKVVSEAKEKGAKALLEIGKVGLTYQELSEEQRMPILRRRVSRTKNGDPFNVTQHRKF